MYNNYFSLFCSDILPLEFLQQYSGKNPKWGYNGLGYIVYKRTYARKLPDGSNEEWWQTVARCINGAQEIGADYTKEEAQELYDYIFNLKCSYAGRMLWLLGTDVVKRFNSNGLLNCWATSIRKIEDFCFLFENLMLGGGVGFSVKKEDIHELPRIQKNVLVTHECTKDADYIVPDSREGWVKLLHKTLYSFFHSGKSFTYSTILIRGAGEPIKGFGGTASGPRILIEGLEKIVQILKNREGKKLRSIDVLDICNIIGSIVVAGNVRRSALIALGDPDDYLYLRAKRWDLGGIPNWRAFSNNTIFADSYDQISEDVWTGYNGNGEPYGFFNLPLSQKKGRLKDKKKDNGILVNPCAEIILADKECCNLSEVFLPNITSKEELLRCCILLYKTQKAVCAGKFIHDETNDVVHKNMRIGVGMGGICQAIDKLDWLDEIYKKLEKFDEEWSKQKGYNKSIRLTTVKPSGSISILSGVTPGVHPGYSQYFIRRIRIASNDKLVETCKKLGYPMEFLKNFDGTENHDTYVISFPCELSEKTIFAKDMSAVRQLELVKQMQTEWSDNSVSVTVYYRKEELPDIKEWLDKNYENSLKTVSFLLHSDHGFAQAPYEEIDEKHYKELIKKVKPISNVMDIGNEILEDVECVGGVCPVR